MNTISHEPVHLPWFARTCTSTAFENLLHFKVIDQKSRLRVRADFVCFCLHDTHGQYLTLSSSRHCLHKRQNTETAFGDYAFFSRISEAVDFSRPYSNSDGYRHLRSAKRTKRVGKSTYGLWKTCVWAHRSTCLKLSPDSLRSSEPRNFLI